MVHFEGSFARDFAISLLTWIWRPKRTLFFLPHYVFWDLITTRFLKSFASGTMGEHV
jgi:hypothetical protein